MEGLKVIEKSYSCLQNFKQSITSSSFSSATQLNIVLKNYDMKTQNGIKEALIPVLEVYKKELDIDNVYRYVSGQDLHIQIPNDVDGFRDDLVDALKTYIEGRAAQLFTIITNSSSSGGLYGI